MKKESKRPTTDQKNIPPEEANPNIYLKYSGMAFQMGFIILIGAMAGRKLDGYFHNPKPWFTIVLSLVAIFVALYLNLKDFISHNNNQQHK